MRNRKTSVRKRASQGGEAQHDEHRLWYKDAIIYEVHVRAFYDSTGDGIGDFAGLTQKLDYVRALGVTAIWLLPFYPSPLKDDGYDTADYTGVHPDYGTLHDFKDFLKEAHARGLRVITELVLNHTSDQHPWFQRARRAEPGTPERDFYVWSDTAERYQDARVIFQDFELSNWTWDPVAGAYYWHRFYSHQPDLNYGNPRVFDAILEVIDHWLDMGVDGLRLDAVPYLAEAEGTHSENLPETHAILKRIRRHIDEKYGDRMLLAEANQWPEDAVAYFGDGDECHMAFHFPLMPRLFMALRQENTFPILDIMAQTPDIPPESQWALFLRNHDELTLEMVTEEERLYMWRTYAHDPDARINLGIRRRLAPLLGNDRRRMELMNGLLLSMPGTPVIYYGDEIGMGDNIYLGDRNSVRTPMQWNMGRNAGFSDAHPQRLYLPLIIDPEFHHATVHVEAQENNPNSLLRWMQKVLGLRRRYIAFGRGTTEFLETGNRRVLAFLRCYQDEIILVVANLSRFAQHCELNLPQFRDLVPFDLFGRSPFPDIGDRPYPLMIGPHEFHWFSLEKAADEENGREQTPDTWPELIVEEEWPEAIAGETRLLLEDLLPGYLAAQPWFLGGDKRILACRIRDRIAITDTAGPRQAYLVLVGVDYADGDPETYTLPLAFASGARASAIEQEKPYAVLARLGFARSRRRPGLLYDAMYEPRFASQLLNLLMNGSRFVRSRDLQVMRTPMIKEIKNSRYRPGDVQCLDPGRSNSAIVFSSRLFLKLFRRIDEGINPAVEIGAFLAQQKFQRAPAIVASLQYRGRRELATLAVLELYVENQGTAWEYAKAEVARYLERTEQTGRGMKEARLDSESLLAALDREIPSQANELIGPYLDAARLLGQRIAELHIVLTSDSEHPSFALEPYTDLYQRSLYQRLRTLTISAFESLEKHSSVLPPDLGSAVQTLLDRRQDVLARYEPLRTRKFTALRIRCHGNCHLEEILYTGGDFSIIDFEGEAALPLYERRLKMTPLNDAISLLRSLFYAAEIALLEQAGPGSLLQSSAAALRARVRFWQFWSGVAFLQSYIATAQPAGFIPSGSDFTGLFDILLVGRTVYELGYELANRQDAVVVPLADLMELLDIKE